MLPFLLGAFVGWLTASGGEKTQDLRLWDVFALGPWLVVLSQQQAPLKDWQRTALLFTAGATITHNGRNYLERKKCPTAMVSTTG